MWLTLAQAAPQATQAARKLQSTVEQVSETGGPTTYGTTLDYAVIIGYLILILGFGSFFGRYTRSTRDFFFSGAKFSWWLIGMSMVATGVGSHSFIKYAQVGYEHGMSSGMSYMNDWFFIPLFMFGWLPIIYFSRVRSIPEYFQRRFNTPARFLAVLVILEYMLGYIGYNLFTLGTVAHQVLGVEIWQAIVIISIISGIYITAGGQTAVIFTDLAQGFMLLFAGLVLFVLGLDALALDGSIVSGFKTLWATLDLKAKIPFAGFNEPQSFNFIAVFWQDGVAGSITFLFISQGLIMRFMAAKSVNEGRKAILFNTVFILPLSMIVVGNAGWVGQAMVTLGLIDAPREARDIFATVAETICHPGVFGFVLAALSAALMSTIDTLTNATASLFIYDIYQPYLNRGASDRHYMRAARWTSAVTALIGMGIGLFFMQFGKDMYKIHGMFQAFVSPPIVAAVLLGAFWWRFTSAGAIAAILGGMIGIGLGTRFPVLVAPFAHGVQPDRDGGYTYMIACFGLAVAGACGVVASFFSQPKSKAQLAGLWVGSVDFGRWRFKGGEPNFRPGRKVHRQALRLTSDGTTPETTALTYSDYQAQFLEPGDTGARIAPPGSAQATAGTSDAAGAAPAGGPPAASYPLVRLSGAQLARLAAAPGDLLYVSDQRWWLGGLRSAHCRAGAPHDEPGVVWMHETAFRDNSLLPDRKVKIEKIF